jgi:outer membrane protein
MKKLVKVALFVAGLTLTGGVVNAQQKIAHINSQELIEAMPETKAAKTTYEAFAKQKQTDIEAMNTEFQKKTTVFSDKQKTVSEANKESLTKELQVMYNELQEMEKRLTTADQSAQQELQKKQEELYSPIVTKATTAVNAVAKEKGYAYVLDVSQPTVVYFAGGDDLLPAVKTKLGIPATAAK